MPPGRNARRLGHMGSHDWEHGGLIHTFTWVGITEDPVTRVYALAFCPDNRILLVGDGGDDGLIWLPGGGVEGEETGDEALVRELQEEAGGMILAQELLGLQRVDRSDGTSEHHSFYWARITLDPDFTPEHEILELRFVEPGDFLDTLFWGRSDPKAPMMLEMALERDREYTPQD